jgi:hypothetical protein
VVARRKSWPGRARIFLHHYFLILIFRSSSAARITFRAREGRLTLIRYASANANLFEYGQPFFQVCDQIVDVLDSHR